MVEALERQGRDLPQTLVLPGKSGSARCARSTASSPDANPAHGEPSSMSNSWCATAAAATERQGSDGAGWTLSRAPTKYLPNR
jgi:hypothetical protein